MSNKTFYIVLGLAVLVGGYLFLRSRRASAAGAEGGNAAGAKKISAIFGVKTPATSPVAKSVVQQLMGLDVVRKFGKEEPTTYS